MGGISFLTVLFLTFLLLKFTCIITWSWYWIFAPVWMPIIFFIVAYLIILKIAVNHKMKIIQKNK